MSATLDHDLTPQAQALHEGRTRRVHLAGEYTDFEAWVHPNADLDGEFVALCAETGDRLRVHGWNCIITDA